MSRPERIIDHPLSVKFLEAMGRAREGEAGARDEALEGLYLDLETHLGELAMDKYHVHELNCWTPPDLIIQVAASPTLQTLYLVQLPYVQHEYQLLWNKAVMSFDNSLGGSGVDYGFALYEKAEEVHFGTSDTFLHQIPDSLKTGTIAAAGNLTSIDWTIPVSYQVHGQLWAGIVFDSALSGKLEAAGTLILNTYSLLEVASITSSTMPLRIDGNGGSAPKVAASTFWYYIKVAFV